MIKKSLFIGAIMGVLAVPLFASAAVVSSVTAVWGATSSVAVPPASVVVMPVPCYPFGRSLSIGATGSDVTALQNYLNAGGYLNVSATGYFGVLTKAAVGRWQAQNNITVPGSGASGIFGPLSRGLFVRVCGGTSGNTGGGGGGQSGGGNNNSSTTQTSQIFSANPQSGIAPLTVQFVATAPQGTTLGNGVNFGDGTQGTLGVVPVCSSCNEEAIVSHTYVAAGTYTATLTRGVCACPVNGVCNCPNIQILATTTVVVGPASATVNSTSSIQQLNSPGNVTLSAGGIAEIRNESAYFTLQSITSSSATIQISPVGCWNSFPSDPKPKIVCMLALVPIPPQTLAVGQTYTSGNYSITLTQISNTTATFDVQ
jgi:peptidoglycan hydrolase-like protein with peptidoglycan-binding domain